jgi:uncharacterized coiled-coil protein SlyX
MQFDMTITLTAVLTLLGMIGVVVGLVITLRVMLKEFGMRLTGLEKSSTKQADEITELRKLVTQIAVQHERLTAMSERITGLDRRVDDLAHGRGFVIQDFNGYGKIPLTK